MSDIGISRVRLVRSWLGRALCLSRFLCLLLFSFGHRRILGLKEGGVCLGIDHGMHACIVEESVRRDRRSRQAQSIGKYCYLSWARKLGLDFGLARRDEAIERRRAERRSPTGADAAAAAAATEYYY
jgi:hypothetical protein